MRKLGSRYVLHALLGRGTSGDVWRGTRIDDDSEIAIKVLRPELADNGAIVDRFLREYSVLLELDGPNIVRVHDLVVDDEVLAIVMDLVEGVDLRDYLRRTGQLSPARALDVILGVLEALAVVHEAGIVHRDVKPENILIESDPQGGLRPKLTDFGISTLTHSPRVSRMTDVVGTPTYMAPELAEGEPPSPASDLYAVGVVFFELVTGQPPFDAPHPIGMLRAHREEPVPPIAGLSPAVAGILGDLLAKSPRRRPPSAREAWRALVGAADHDARQVDLNRVLPRHAPPTEAPRPPMTKQRESADPRRAAGVGLEPVGERMTDGNPPLSGWHDDDNEHTFHTAEQWAAAGAAAGAAQGFWTKDGSAYVTPATGAGGGGGGIPPERSEELTQVGGQLTAVGAAAGAGPMRPTGPMRPNHDDMSSTMVSRAVPMDSSDLDTGPLPQQRASTATVGGYPTGGSGGGGRQTDYEDRRRKWIVAGATTAVLLVAGLGGWALAAEPGAPGTDQGAQGAVSTDGAAQINGTPAPVPSVMVTTMFNGTMTTVPSPVPAASRPGASVQPVPPGQTPSEGPQPTQPSDGPAPTTSPPPPTSGPVPAINGLTPAAARNEVVDAGFTAGTASEELCAQGVQVGRVHQQNPNAGAVTPFTTVIQFKIMPDNCATVPVAQGSVATTVTAIKNAGFATVNQPAACQYGVNTFSVDLGGWYIPTTTTITVTATCKPAPAPTTTK